MKNKINYKEKYLELVKYIQDNYKQSREENAKYIVERGDAETIQQALEMIDCVDFEDGVSPDTAFEIGEVRAFEMIWNEVFIK